jgi:hypothetical protein
MLNRLSRTLKVAGSKPRPLSVRVAWPALVVAKPGYLRRSWAGSSRDVLQNTKLRIVDQRLILLSTQSCS